MAVGIMHQMWAPADCSDSELLDQAGADVGLAESLGFDSIMFGEHHFRPPTTYFGRVPVPELFIARLSATTRTIQLGTGVKVLALDSPWRTAEAMLLLDLLTEGRAFFCIGQGTTLSVFPAGTTDDQRRAMFRAHLQDLLSLLRGEKPDTVSAPPLGPAPIRDLVARIWVAARDPATVEMAAAEGLRFVVGQAEHDLVQGEHVERYRAAGGRFEARGVRVACVAETDAAAVAAATQAVETYYAVMSKGPYYLQAVARGIIPGGPPASPAEAMERLSFAVGSPSTVARRLHDYQRTTGVDRIDVMFHLPGLRPDDVERSMRLFAEAVMPEFADIPVADATPPP